MYNLHLDEIKPEGGLLAHTAQEIHRSSVILAKLQKWSIFKQYILGKILPMYYYSLDKRYPINEFTIGYMVQATKL